MKKILGISLLIIVVCFVVVTLSQNDYPIKFVGYFYPYGSRSNNTIESPAFKTLDDCIDWIDAMKINLIQKDIDSNLFDYECMKNCDYGDKYNQDVSYTCQETVY